MKFHYQEFGTGKAIVLLHAFPLSASMWKHQVSPLVVAGWRVILPDFPGFGKSLIDEKISRMEYLAIGVSNLLSDLKIDQIVIGGLSMGGYVALNFVRMFPGKASALILAGTNASADSEEKKASRFTLIEKVKKEGSKILIDGMLPNVVSDYSRINNTDLIKTLKNDFEKASEDGVSAALQGMAERKDHNDFLDAINIPTLLIFGEQDKITDLDSARLLKRKIKNSTLVTIPNAGHYSNLEQPELFNKTIIDFLTVNK